MLEIALNAFGINHKIIYQIYYEKQSKLEGVIREKILCINQIKIYNKMFKLNMNMGV